MKLLKINIGNCILGCCKNSKWNYDDKKIFDILSNNDIDRVILFSCNIKNSFNDLIKIFDFLKPYNLKISLRTIFYNLDSNVFKELLNKYPNIELEIFFNEESNFLKEQSSLRKIISKEFIEKNIKFDILNIINSEDETYIKNLLDTGEYPVPTRNAFLLFTNIHKNKLVEISNSNNYNMVSFSDLDEYVCIELNYNNCETKFSDKPLYSFKKW